MSNSRKIESSGRPVVSVLSNGTEVPESVAVMAVQIRSEFNRISTAILSLVDGDPANEEFAISAGELFVPGAEVEIKLGYSNDDMTTVFKGVLVKQKIKARKKGSVLQVECKHGIFRSAYSEKYAVFTEKTDTDILEEIIGNYNVSSAIESTSVTHQNMVQYRCTDWDFMVSRAESTAQVLLTDTDEVKTIKPEVKTEPDLALQYGATVLNFEAELDGRHQEDTLTLWSWDYSNGERIDSAVQAPDLNSVGNLQSSDLAEALSNNPEFTHATALHTQEESELLAKSEQNRRRLSKIIGTVTCQGTTEIKPGGTVELGGFGDRFNGNSLVSGVSHLFEKGTWQTTLQLGLNAKPHLEKFKPLPKSSFHIPRVQGLEIGVVTDLEDPNSEFRVQVKLPVFEDQGGVWARVSQLDAGDGRTVFWRPEVGDEVIVGFINDDPRAPVILGMLHSSAKPSPIDQTEDNHEKGIVTRDGLKVLFNDEKKDISISTPNGNKVVLSDDSGSILLEDENSNKIEMTSDGILYESPGDLILKASGDVKVEGVNIQLTASAQMKAEGSAGAEVSSGASTVIKGSLVQIN